jgi:hypothetical protein
LEIFDLLEDAEVDQYIIKLIDRISLERIRGCLGSIDHIFAQSISSSIDRIALADSSTGRNNIDL